MSGEYRNEYKYRLDACQSSILEARARGILQPDAHTSADGTYRIQSLYFDTPEDVCFFDKENGYDRRSKFRIRYYNDDVGFLRLEKKSSRQGMTSKESCPISVEQCRMLMNGQFPVITDEMPEVMQSLFLEMRLADMRPKVIVIYERKPFVWQPGNVRVTFDEGLCSSDSVTAFLDGGYAMRPIFPRGESLLEVKWDQVLPFHIRSALSLDSLQWTGFSKYYLCRKYNCLGGLRA